MSTEQPAVAIACQGGGSQTAFTAGVLKGLLPEVERAYDLVGISGTSGGALCAVTAWYGLQTDGSERASSLLSEVWNDVAVHSPFDRMLNEAVVWNARLAHHGVPTLQMSPYDVPARVGEQWYRRLLERYVDFDRFPALVSEDGPHVTIGAVNVNTGAFETFTDAKITPMAVIASAAVPTVFEAVEIDGDLHWDGLFSQNPPVREFLTGPGRKPDELWVIRINPQTHDDQPRSLGEIADRRNELSGNISLNQELHFIESVNEWVEAGYLPDEYKSVEIREITLEADFDLATKLDRNVEFIEELLTLGEQRATSFLETQLEREVPA